jgi:DNA-binding CsgD family transcriptional regulator
MAPWRNVLVASALAALGYLAAAAIAGADDPVRARVLLVVAAGVVVLPMAGSIVMGRIAAGAAERAAAARASVAARSRVPEPVVPGLTPRQSEVVQLVAAGMKHAEIAECLDVSVNQVRRLLQQARERTGTSTTRELVAVTVSAGRNGTSAPETS